MILCLACGRTHDGPGLHCPSCGAGPASVDGFPAFAPELAAAVEGFDPAAHAVLARSEDGHFWFQGRNRLIVERLLRHFPLARDYLEVGCGTGCVLQAVANAIPALRITGSEVLSAGLIYAAQRVPGARLLQMDARHLPFAQEFDVIAAYDVLEHIREDEAVLAQLHRALKPGGGLLLTVPQHGWLWSRQDEIAHHVRRYERGELEAKLRRSGFEIIYSTSFMAPLLPLVWWSRRGRGRGADIADREMAPGAVVNFVLGAVLCLERLILRFGVRLPVGSSRLVVASKSFKDVSHE